MTNQENSYYQPQQGGQTLPPQIPLLPMQMVPRRRTWRERVFAGTNTRPLTLLQELSIPNWVVGKSVLCFFISMFACWGVYGYVPELDLVTASVLSLILFFYAGAALLRSWHRIKAKQFIKNIFIIGLIARVVWLLYCYYFFNFDHFGAAYGEMADVEWYMPFANDLAQWLSGNSEMTLPEIIDYNGSAIDDVGYPMWLAVGYAIWGEWSDAFIPMLIKCIVGAYCSVCIYHVAKRHFGEGTARMAAMFVALNPNMIYWCGNMFKEAEMMFLCCLCVDLVDKTFTSGNKLTFRSLLPGVLAGMAVFFFRAPLAIVLFIAVFAHIVMASGRVMSAGKKIIAGVMVGTVLLIGMGDRLRSQADRIVNTVQSDAQEQNMEWRSKQKGGNEFAKFAGKTVFAPLIFTIPFPTFNEALSSQVLQMQLSGGNYIKNIFSFFVLLVMFLMLISGEWRKHVFILAYTLGYLVTLVLSNFAHSSRFHMPIWPFLMLFAAYGIQISKNNPRYRRWFTIALVIEIAACLGWNWFKLAGRGLV